MTQFGQKLAKVVDASRLYVNFAAHRWVLTLEEVKGHRRSLLIALAQHADGYGCSFPSAKSLAREIGLSDRTIRRCLVDLEELKLIRRIGRVRNGGQTSNVVVLIGWPGRARIPQSGHPKLGSTIKEHPFDVLKAYAHQRTQCHGGADNVSDQNKRKENNNTTTEARKDFIEEVLNPCIDALGKAATRNNSTYLTNDADTLQRIISNGADLSRHVLPVLYEVGSRPKIPVLRSWGYFIDMITGRMQSDARKDSDTVRNKAENSRFNNAQAEPPNGEEVPYSPPKDAAEDPEMGVFLNRLMKRIPRVSE